MTAANLDLIRQVVDSFNKGQGQIEAISPHLLHPLPKLPAQPFTKMTCTITATGDRGDDVYFTYTATGTHTGEFKGFKATNKTIQWEGWAVATIVNGKISNVQAIEDDWAKLLKLGLQLQLPSMSGKWTTNVLGIQINLDLKQNGRTTTGTASALGQSYPVTGSNDYPSQPNVTLQLQLGAGSENLLKSHGNFTGSERLLDANRIDGSFTLGTLSGSATLTHTS
jgi:hypothetical protein